MWDCKYRTTRDHCRRRKAKCYPGGIGCVLKGMYMFPFRMDEDPLVEKKTNKKMNNKRT